MSRLFASRPAIFAAAVALAAATAVAAPAPVAPAAQPFRVGTLRLWALRDMLNVVPNDGSVFGKDVGPDAVAAALRAAGAPADRVTLGVDALLVALPGHLVLLDTGLGPKVVGVLMASLAQAGFTPAQVTDVLVTHTHGDHVGGLLDAAGRPAFPNALVHLSAPEWAWLRTKPQQAALVQAIAPKVRTFAPGGPVLPGITAVPLPGHTPGHAGYQIAAESRAGAARLLDMGDTAHSSLLSLEHPEWTIGYDTDGAAGRATRERELAALAKSGETVWAPHFPFPGFGHVVARPGGYAWVPAAL